MPTQTRAAGGVEQSLLMVALDLRIQNLLLPVIHMQKHQEEHSNIPEGDQALMGDLVSVI